MFSAILYIPRHHKLPPDAVPGSNGSPVGPLSYISGPHVCFRYPGTSKMALHRYLKHLNLTLKDYPNHRKTDFHELPLVERLPTTMHGEAIETSGCFASVSTQIAL